MGSQLSKDQEQLKNLNCKWLFLYWGQSVKRNFRSCTKTSARSIRISQVLLSLRNSSIFQVQFDESQPIELAQNPLVKRVIAVLDKNKDGNISFLEFVQGLNSLSAGASQEEKLRFAFQIYDINNDNYISNGELFAVLKMMVGNNLNEVQLQQLVDRTIIKADEDFDGKISFEEFCKVRNCGVHLVCRWSRTSMQLISLPLTAEEQVKFGEELCLCFFLSIL